MSSGVNDSTLIRLSASFEREEGRDLGADFCELFQPPRQALEPLGGLLADGSNQTGGMLGILRSNWSSESRGSPPPPLLHPPDRSKRLS